MCLRPEDELGTGFIMTRIEGETIARKILRDEQFANARPILARQLGGVIAGIHDLPTEKLPKLREMNSTKELVAMEREYRSSAGRVRCSNWRCAGCANAIPARRRK